MNPFHTTFVTLSLEPVISTDQREWRNPCILRCLQEHTCLQQETLRWASLASLYASPFGFFDNTSSREMQGFLHSRWSVEMTGFFRGNERRWNAATDSSCIPPVYGSGWLGYWSLPSVSSAATGLRYPNRPPVPLLGPAVKYNSPAGEPAGS